MTLLEFTKYFKQHAMYEAIYDDPEGRRIVVICLLDLYELFKKVERGIAIPNQDKGT